MLQVAIGTKNPAKIKAIISGFSDIEANFTSLDVPSGVSPQPFSDDETIEGAINRARYALNHGDFTIGLGLEGGVVETKYGLFLCNWGAIITSDNTPIIAGGARVPLPDSIASKLKDGHELGEVMEIYTKTKGIRHKEGAIGIFTNGYVNRSSMFTHVVRLLVGQYLYRQ